MPNPDTMNDKHILSVQMNGDISLNSFHDEFLLR